MLGRRNINCISCGEGANAGNMPVKHVTGKDGALYRTDIDIEAMDIKRMRSKSPKIKKNKADMATYYATDKDGVERKKKGSHARFNSLITEDEAKRELEDLTKDIKDTAKSHKGSIMRVLSKRASTNTTSMCNMRDSHEKKRR